MQKVLCSCENVFHFISMVQLPTTLRKGDRKSRPAHSSCCIKEVRPSFWQLLPDCLWFAATAVAVGGIHDVRRTSTRWLHSCRRRWAVAHWELLFGAPWTRAALAGRSC